MSIRSYNDLPPRVLDYLVGFDVMERYGKALVSVGLPENDQAVVNQVTEDVVLGKTNLLELPRILQTSMSLKDEQAKSLAVQIAKNILLPIAEEVGDVEGTLRVWAPSAPAKPEAPLAPAPSTPPRLPQTPSLKEGGGSVMPSGGGVGAPPVPVIPVKASPSTASKPVVPAAPIAAVSPVVTKPRDSSQPITPPSPRPTGSSGRAPFGRGGDVGDLVALANLKDPEQKKRLERIIDSRLHDIRDAYATRAEIEKPVTAGGVGISGRPLADLMEKIEAAAEGLVAESAAKVVLDKAEHVQKNIAKMNPDLSARAKEEQLLARRYAELTGKAPTVPVGASAMRSSLGISAEQSIAQAAKRVDAQKVKQAIASSLPQPPRTQASHPGGPPRAGGGISARPPMQDVQPVRRLSGPLDELRALSLADFRRLSKNPKEAAGKITDKVDLLEGQGYDQRVAAIKAWRASPLNRWYVAATNEALLRGLSLQALLAEKRMAGAEAPSDMEAAAVLILNGQLRF